MAWVKQAVEPPIDPPEWPAFGMLMDFVYNAARFITIEQFWAAVESGITGKEPEEVLEAAKKEYAEDESTAPFGWSWDTIADFVADQVNADWEPKQIIDMVRDYHPEIPHPK